MKNIRKLLLLITTLCASLVFFVNCSNNLVNPQPGATSNNNFFISSPSSSSRLSMDSSATIFWISTANVTGNTVRISLYNDSQYVMMLTQSTHNSTSDTVTSSYTVPANVMAGINASGSKYRIKITSNADTTKYDFSSYFTIYSDFTGTITVSAPISSSIVKLDSSLTINWSVTDSPGTSLNLKLYKDTTYISTITAAIGIAAGSYTWTTVLSTYGSGSNYRIKATSNSDASIYGYSTYFPILPPYAGTFSALTVKDSAWRVGDSCVITWDTTGYIGSANVVLQLCQDSVVYSTIAARTANSKSYIWIIPYTINTGSNYRIEISSSADQGIHLYSQKLSITGIATDAFEPDNQITSAHSIPTNGTVQNRTITVNDTDFCSFSATANDLYLIKTTGIIYTSIALDTVNATNQAVQLTAANLNFRDTNTTLTWMCPASATYYIRVLAAQPGSYTISANGYDSTAYKINITAPVNTDTLTRGAAFQIQWTSVAVGGNVSIVLFQNGNMVRAIAMVAPNTGTYKWTVQNNLTAGSNYYIVVTSSVNQIMTGQSMTFSIK